MEMKNNRFPLCTLDNCLFCFDNISEVSKINLNDLKKSVKKFKTQDVNINRTFSLRSISRYLKIDLRTLPSLSKTSVALLNKTDVRVSLCKECGKVMQKFTEQYRAMELSKMRLNQTLNVIQKRMNLPKEDPSMFVKYQRKVHSSLEAQFLKHSKMAQEIREKFKSKGSEKLMKQKPQLRLEKIQFEKEVSNGNNNESFSTDSVPIIKYELNDYLMEQESTKEFEETFTVDEAADSEENQRNSSNVFTESEGLYEIDQLSPSSTTNSIIIVETGPIAYEEMLPLKRNKIFTKNKMGLYSCRACLTTKTFTSLRRIRLHHEAFHLGNIWRNSTSRQLDFGRSSPSPVSPQNSSVNNYASTGSFANSEPLIKYEF